MDDFYYMKVFEPNSEYHSQTEALKRRTKNFALAVVQLFKALRSQEESRIMGRQLIRSSTSVAANYRAVCRARTRAQFISKLDIVVEEADESHLWLELLVESALAPESLAGPLLQEAQELTRIFAAARATSIRRSRPDS